jgi:hypothetical protein
MGWPITAATEENSTKCRGRPERVSRCRFQAPATLGASTSVEALLVEPDDAVVVEDHRRVDHAP